MARHREGDANQQYDRHFEEQRQRADETGETNRIVRAIVAKGFEHLDGNLIDRPRFMQDLPEHRAERDDDRQKPSVPPIPFSIVAAILSSGMPEKRPAPIETTIKATKACIRAFMTKNSSSNTEPTAVKTSVKVLTSDCLC